jgi:hypothetical protein
MKETLSFLEKREYSILERRPSSQRMREREEAGKKHNKQKKMKHGNEDFWEEWENENQ